MSEPGSEVRKVFLQVEGYDVGRLEDERERHWALEQKDQAAPILGWQIVADRVVATLRRPFGAALPDCAARLSPSGKASALEWLLELEKSVPGAFLHLAPQAVFLAEDGERLVALAPVLGWHNPRSRRQPLECALGWWGVLSASANGAAMERELVAVESFEALKIVLVSSGEMSADAISQKVTDAQQVELWTRQAAAAEVTEPHAAVRLLHRALLRLPSRELWHRTARAAAGVSDAGVLATGWEVAKGAPGVTGSDVAPYAAWLALHAQNPDRAAELARAAISEGVEVRLNHRALLLALHGARRGNELLATLCDYLRGWEDEDALALLVRLAERLHRDDAADPILLGYRHSVSRPEILLARACALARAGSPARGLADLVAAARADPGLSESLIGELVATADGLTRRVHPQDFIDRMIQFTRQLHADLPRSGIARLAFAEWLLAGNLMDDAERLAAAASPGARASNVLCRILFHRGDLRGALKHGRTALSNPIYVADRDLVLMLVEACRCERDAAALPWLRGPAGSFPEGLAAFRVAEKEIDDEQ